MIIEELSTGGTPLGSSSEIPVEVRQGRLLILISNLGEEASSNLTIGSSPSSGELTLVTSSLKELTVNGTAEEPSISLDDPLNLLLGVLLGGVKLLELHTLGIVSIRVTEPHHLVLGGTIRVNSAVVTSKEELVARKVGVELLEAVPLRLDVSAPAVGTGTGELRFTFALTTSKVSDDLKLLLAANSVLVVLDARLRNLEGSREVDTLCLGLELGNVKLAIVPVVLKDLAVPLEEITKVI